MLNFDFENCSKYLVIKNDTLNIVMSEALVNDYQLGIIQIKRGGAQAFSSITTYKGCFQRQ